eukprot:GEMP01053362.1.p2 GENE.GEMP01053362.1~~GEMP01053362.1.p2  ORF type:complete len:132 (+),score=16.90 GEMP01053362.1:89-484(+)
MVLKQIAFLTISAQLALLLAYHVQRNGFAPAAVDKWVGEIDVGAFSLTQNDLSAPQRSTRRLDASDSFASVMKQFNHVYSSFISIFDDDYPYQCKCFIPRENDEDLRPAYDQKHGIGRCTTYYWIPCVLVD